MIPIFRVQDIDHKGIVAAICDELKLVHDGRKGATIQQEREKLML
ncbi:MAG: hypothetical protein PUP93_02185 [Rhizonema sp. NSF051]|nr:hypothetical protein [Rhizonema sp. NSF051]